MCGVHAVDAASGEEIWRTPMADIAIGETITMAPMVVKGKVLVGNSGGEFGVRGWLTALDAATGAVAWKAYSTGPDRDVLIGADFRPFYKQDQGKDLGVSSWPAEQWKIGGGTVWGWISYDPELDLIFHGTGNPGVWNPAMRPGDNKWASSLFARDPDTGEAKWAYQTTPHDEHDFDGVNESILVDLEPTLVVGDVAVAVDTAGHDHHAAGVDDGAAELVAAPQAVGVAPRLLQAALRTEELHRYLLVDAPSKRTPHKGVA